MRIEGVENLKVKGLVAIGALEVLKTFTQDIPKVL